MLKIYLFVHVKQTRSFCPQGWRHTSINKKKTTKSHCHWPSKHSIKSTI